MQLGYCNRAFSLPQHLALQAIVATVMFPSFAQLLGDPRRLSSAFARATRMSATAILPCAGILVPLAKPTIVCIFGETWEPSCVAFAAQALGVPCAFYVFDRWLLHVLERFTQSPGRWRRLVKGAALAPILRRLDFNHAAFGSRYLQDCYTAEPVIAPRDTEALYHGLRLDEWPVPRADAKLHDPCPLLFVGQVGHHKGVHTILEALEQIEAGYRFELDIVGTGPVDYQERLSDQAARLKRTTVRLLGKKPREELPRICADHDLLLFPSIIDEGLGLVIVESMACGTPAIVSRTGGSPETVEGPPIGNTFERENAGELALRVEGLVSEPERWRELREWSIGLVRSRFSFGRTVRETERFLARVAERGGRLLSSPCSGGRTGRSTAQLSLIWRTELPIM